MSVVLILSDYVTPEQRGEIIHVIQQYGEWVTLSESSYAIHTALTPEQLHYKLKERIDIRDGLQILKVSNSYRGRAPLKIREWLNSETLNGSFPVGASVWPLHEERRQSAASTPENFISRPDDIPG